MLSYTLLTLHLALLPLAFSLPRPYYNNGIPFYQNKWQISPFYSVPFHPDFQSPWSTVYQTPYRPFFEALDGYYNQMPIDSEAKTENPHLSESDIRNNEVVASAEENIVDDTELAKTHRQKRSPLYFGFPSSSAAYSNSGASSYSGLGGSFSNTFGNSGASSTGGGFAFGSSNSKAGGASFGGFGGPSFSGSSSNTHALAFSRPSYNPWSWYSGR